MAAGRHDLQAARHTVGPDRSAGVLIPIENAIVFFGLRSVSLLEYPEMLADPFRRDALSKPVRDLDKYKDFV